MYLKNNEVKKEGLNTKFDNCLLDLVISVYKTYIERKEDKEIIKEIPGKVVRGTIPAVASKFEDEFGIFLHRILGSEYSILIDYPVQLRGERSMVPDVIVIKDGVIKLILELKNDLGYARADWKDKQIRGIERLNKVGVITYSEYNSKLRTKTLKELAVPLNVPYGTVILCQKNGRSKVKEIIEECTAANCEGDKVPYFILMKDKNVHANDILFEDELFSYLENVLYTEVTSDWNRLKVFLTTHLMENTHDESK